MRREAARLQILQSATNRFKTNISSSEETGTELTTTFRPATRPEVRLQQITADRSKEGGGKNPGVSVVAAAQSSLPPPNHYYGVANCQKPTGAAAMAAGAAEAATNRTSPVGQKRVETQLMADAALERLLEKLQQLLLYEAQLVKNVKTQLEKLEMNLRVFRAFLADSAQSVKDDDDAVFEELVRQASDVIYEVEDVVDQCRRRSRNSAAVCEAKTSVNTDSGLTYNFSTGVGRDLLIASAGPGGFSTVDAIQNTKTHQKSLSQYISCREESNTKMAVIPSLKLRGVDKLMPLIGMGTASFPPADLDTTKAAVLEAIKAGYRHFDTAFAYGSEKALGEAVTEALRLGLVQSRDDLFITTKLWASFAEPSKVVAACEMSLQKSAAGVCGYVSDTLAGDVDGDGETNSGSGGDRGALGYEGEK